MLVGCYQGAMQADLRQLSEFVSNWMHALEPNITKTQLIQSGQKHNCFKQFLSTWHFLESVFPYLKCRWESKKSCWDIWKSWFKSRCSSKQKPFTICNIFKAIWEFSESSKLNANWQYLWDLGVKFHTSAGNPSLGEFVENILQ